MLNPKETCLTYLRCKQITNCFRKNVAIYKQYIPRKMSLKFQNSESDFSCKIES